MSKYTEIKKIGIMAVSAKVTGKKTDGARENKFSVAVYLPNDTRATAAEYFRVDIAAKVKAGERDKARALALGCGVYSRRSAAVMAARDISGYCGAQLQKSIAEAVAEAEKAERPYIERAAERAKERAEKAAARAIERAAERSKAAEDKILEKADAIRAARAAAGDIRKAA